MKKFKLLLSALAMVGALGLAPVASANTVDVGGILLPLGSATYAGNIFENSVQNVGDPLAGYGQITSFNSTTNICAGGAGSCALTYVFGGYKLATLDSSGNATFTGGWVNLYYHDSSLSQVTSSNASNGTLWLSMVAAPYAFDGATTVDGSTQLVIINGQPAYLPTGNGFLSVSGSATANSYFDTNSYTSGSLGALVNPADVFFRTGITGTTNQELFTLTGSSSGSYLAVPEPNDLGMMGLGLLMVGVMGLRFRQSQFRRS